MTESNARNVLITGANRGIGLELARIASARGAHVVAACRATSTELTALGVEIVEGVEVSDATSRRALVGAIGDRALDVVIHNAGILRSDALGSIDEASVRQQLEVNAIAPLMLTEALAPRLREGSKLAVVTSRMGSIADNGSGGSYGYRMSKAAVNAAFKSLAIDLGKKGVLVAILHPGWVRTEMTRGTGHASAAESAAQIWQRIDALDASTSGKFQHANGEALPW